MPENCGTFISDLFGGVILASSTFISPAGILFKHWKEKKNSTRLLINALADQGGLQS